MMEKVDRRIQRTQDLLGDALISLIVEKGYDEVTIRDVTERANVAYSTFFRHYRDKDELLTSRLGEEIEELIRRIEAASAADPHDATVEGALIFQHAQEHSVLYRVLLSSIETVKVRQRIRQVIAAIFSKTCQPIHQKEANIPPDVAANHMAIALLGLIEWWLEHDMPYPVEQMTDIYERLILKATLDSI
jgi:AcrR family transcriptional regulator